MKKLLLMAMFMILFCSTVIADDAVVFIGCAEQLANMSEECSYVLVTDIELPEDWRPIDFRGSLDGRGHTIRGGNGLFGLVENAIIKNLVLEDFSVCTAGLLAEKAVDSQIANINIKNGAIRSSGNHDAIGGLVGRLHNCIVENVIIDIEIEAAADFIGGVVGIATNTRFYSSGVDGGRLVGEGVIGGFAGELAGMGLMLACHSNADVTGKIAGGFVGQIAGEELLTNANHKIEIIESTATGNVSAETGGGFAGTASFASIVECGAYGDVTSEKVGGFVARLVDRSRVIYSYAKGNATGEVAGGFVGEIAKGACIEFGFSAGTVMGEDIVGGFVGVITDDGEPNTITGSLSFAPWVVGSVEGKVHRFAGYAAHRGVNGCYALLSSMVVRGDELLHVLPNAYGSDGGDMSAAQVEEITTRLGWRVDKIS